MNWLSGLMLFVAILLTIFAVLYAGFANTARSGSRAREWGYALRASLLAGAAWALYFVIGWAT